jgi:soluble cytochrome b562
VIKSFLSFFKYLLLIFIVFNFFVNLIIFIKGKLKKKKIIDIEFTKLFDFLKYTIIDVIRDIKLRKQGIKTFGEYGCTIYVNEQGAGKTASMVEYLDRMKRKYPKVKILTNFGYKKEDKAFVDWDDMRTYRNGLDGVIFAIDEIASEYDNQTWKAFPKWLMREISQQRKQRIKIILSSQVYSDVVKQIRNQCFEVVECRGIGSRWIFQRAFNAREYNQMIDNPTLEMRELKRKWRYSFIFSDRLRDLYDSYKKVEELKK